MTQIILPNKVYEAFFADTSIATGKFAALLPKTYNVLEIVQDFSNVSHFVIKPEDMPEKEMEGFTAFDSLLTLEDGIQIILRKGE